MLLVNGAGGSAADPILSGLGIVLAFAASSMDVAAVNDAFIDQASGFPGTNSVKASLTPAATVLTSGASGGYNDTTKQWSIGDTTNLSANDPVYLSHGSITDGIYLVASVVNGTDVTVVGNPLNGAGNQSNIAYQVGWSWQGAAGGAPSQSSAGGTQNWFKADVEDAGTIATQFEDSFFVRNAPATASDYIALEGGAYTGQTVSDNLHTLQILSGWSNAGGVAYVEMANHSGQGVNNFTWQTGGGTGEKTLAEAEGGLQASAGDGMKYGRLLLKAYSGGVAVGVDIDINVDTAGPTVVMAAFAA